MAGNAVANLDAGMQAGAAVARMHKHGADPIVLELSVDNGATWAVVPASASADLRDEIETPAWPAKAESILGMLTTTQAAQLEVACRCLRDFPAVGGSPPSGANLRVGHHQTTLAIDDRVWPAPGTWAGIVTDAGSTSPTPWDARCATTLAGLSHLTAPQRADLASVVIAAATWG